MSSKLYYFCVLVELKDVRHVIFEMSFLNVGYIYTGKSSQPSSVVSWRSWGGICAFLGPSPVVGAVRYHRLYVTKY